MRCMCVAGVAACCVYLARGKDLVLQPAIRLAVQHLLDLLVTLAHLLLAALANASSVAHNVSQQDGDEHGLLGTREPRSMHWLLGFLL